MMDYDERTLEAFKYYKTAMLWYCWGRKDSGDQHPVEATVLAERYANDVVRPDCAHRPSIQKYWANTRREAIEQQRIGF